MQKPLISVIVPIYNVEKYLGKCVQSILAQTYTNLEIFLVDDGSPDRCGEMCDEYARQDSRIKVIHKPNGGLSDARNVAINIATGEWIVCVDSDDYVSMDYIETLYGLVSCNDAQVGVAWHQEFYEGSEPVVTQPNYVEKVMDSNKAIEKMFYQELFDTAAWCKIYHRSLFDDGIRYPKGILYEDLPTTYLLMKRAKKVAFCNKIILYYLLRKTSIEGQAFSIKKLQSALFIIDSIKIHEQEFPELEKAIRCRLFSLSMHILMEMPAAYPDERKQILIHYVKNNRWKVLTDLRARKKARVGALISYLGLDIAKKALARVKSRDKQ